MSFTTGNRTPEIPESWKQLLREMHENGFPEAVIAGGALRDLVNGVAPKDIDVFVDFKDSMRERLLEGPARDRTGLLRPIIEHGYAGERLSGRAGEDVAAVYEFLAPNIDIPVQVIALNVPVSPHYITKRVDFGMSEIVYDGALYTTHAFHNDVLNNKFTLTTCSDEEDFKKSVKRFERISKRYPGYTFSPGQYSDFYTKEVA